MTDTAAIPRVPHIATSGEDIPMSESRFAITFEHIDKHRPCPITTPQNHTSTVLESNTSSLEEKNITASLSDHVTFGNNHSSISSQMCKTTSGGADVQNWESSAHSVDIILNADSTASVNISGKGYVPSISSEDDIASPKEETVAVFKNIATLAGDSYTAPTDIATNEDNVAAASGVSLIFTTVLRDICSATNSEETISDPGHISVISSGEKISGSTDTFSAVSTGDTTITIPSLSSILVFKDTSDTQAISGFKDRATTAGDITTAPRDFSANPVSDSGEISHITFKEAPPSLPGDPTVLLQGGVARVFTTDTLFCCSDVTDQHSYSPEPTDTSGIIPTFSATTENITSNQKNLPIISGSTNNLTCSNGNTAVEGTLVTGDSRDRNKTDTISREAEASISAVPTMTPRDTCKVSSDGLNVSSNTTNTVSLETTKCPITIVSREPSVVTGTKATAFGNITTTHLDTAIINEPFLIIPGNVTNTAGIRDTTTVTPRNVITAPGKKPTTSMAHGETNAAHNGETSTILSDGNSTEAANIIEKDPSIEHDSITLSRNSNATTCIALTSFVDKTAREDTIAIPPENTNQMEPFSSPQNSTIIAAGEKPTHPLKKSLGDSTSKASFRGSTASPVTVGTSTTASQGYSFTNPAGQVTMNCGSTIVSESSVEHKATTTGFGGSAISGNDTNIKHRENNCSVFDDASITSASRETFILSRDTTVNIVTTTSSQNASEQSTKPQVGSYSETNTRKTSTVFGSSTNIHRDTDTTEVNLTNPINTVTTAAAITSTISTPENSNTAVSRRLTSTSQNVNDMISAEVTASTMSDDGTEYMSSRNTATVHFENAVTTVATYTSLGQFESTNTTSLPPRETTSSTGYDTMKTPSGSTLSVCVPASVTEELSATVPTETPISIGKPILEFTSIHGDTLNETVSSDSASPSNLIQDRKLSVATIADDSKTPLDTPMVVPGDITSATNISLLSRELNTTTLEDAANSRSDSINATSSGDTSEDAHYERIITSGHSETEIILGHVSILDSSSSIQTNFQEISKGPGDTNTLLGCTNNILEGAQICHEFASVHSKIPTVLVQTPKANDTATILGVYISTEATRQSESAPVTNAASLSVDNIQSETLNASVTIGTNNITNHKGTAFLNKSSVPDSISTSVISGIFEDTPVPQDLRNTTVLHDANSAFSAGDAAVITTTKSKGTTAASASGDFMKTTTLLKDTTTFTTTSTGATATVTALKDTVMTTQTSVTNIATVSRNKTTTILEDPPAPRKTVTSEKMADATLGDIMTHDQVLTPGKRSCGGIPAGNMIPKETLSNDPSVYYIDRITTDLLASTNIINILSDTISTPNNASSMLEITTSPEGILASRNNCTTTCIQFSVQSQTTIPEAPSPVPEKASFATEENITVVTTSEAGIAHPVPKDAAMADTPEDKTNSHVTFNSSENVTNIIARSVSPREEEDFACIPLDMTSSTLGKTVPLRQRFCSGNAANMNTSLEVCACPDDLSPSKAFSTLACTSHSETSQLVELVTPCLSTISLSECTSKIPEASTGFGNASTSFLFLGGTDQSTGTGNNITSVTTTGIAAFAEPKSITVAPGETHTLVGTTLDESRESVATNTPEHIPTTSGATVAYRGGKATEADVARYTITTTVVAEETVTAPEGNITDLAIPRDKNTETAVASIHARTLAAYGDAISADGDITSGPTTSKVDASLIIPTCTAMISLRETITPIAPTASKDTDILAATAVVGRSPTTAPTVISEEYPTPEVTMVMEETAVWGIITTARETFVPKTTTSFTEARISRSATEFSLAYSVEATISPAETSTGGATFSSGQTTASRNPPSNTSFADEDLIIVTASSSTPSSVKIPSAPFDMGRKTLLFEGDARGASGHPYTPENKVLPPRNVATTVPEDTTIVSGNTSAVSECPVIVTLAKDADNPTTIERALIMTTATSRDTVDTTATECSLIIPRRTTVVPGEIPTINPGEKTTATSATTETAMITGGTNDETGEILTATPRGTIITTFGKALDSTTRETFVAPGETLIISPRETSAATSGKIAGTTCTSTSQGSGASREDASAIPKGTITGIPRETAPVLPGNASESTTKETTTVLHRKSTAVPRKNFTIDNSGANPGNTPGEIPTTAFTVATNEDPPFSVYSNNTPTGVTPEDTSMAAPSMTVSASQEKSRTVIPLPYWSIMLIGITVIIFLLAGFCLVIYYVTVFILVACSASLSSNTFS